MDFETFKTKRLFEEKIYGQVFYQIEEESSSIDFKLLPYGDDFEAVSFFRLDENIENLNSIESDLNFYHRRLFYNPDDIESFMIKKMKRLLGDGYYYNITQFRSNVKVSIIISPEEIDNPKDVLSKALSDRINKFKNYINSNEIKKDYETYVNFNKLMGVDENLFYSKNKIFFLLKNDFVDEYFSILDNSYSYDFKLISSPNLQIKITFYVSKWNKNPNPIEKELMEIVRNNYGQDISQSCLENIINSKMAHLLQSQKYQFTLLDSQSIQNGKVSFIADIHNIDFTSVTDRFAYSIRENVLSFNIPDDYFKSLDEGWNNFKKSRKNKFEFQKIVNELNHNELNFKLEYLFSNDFNNKSFLEIGNNTFSVVGASNIKVKISTKLNLHNMGIIFKSKGRIMPRGYDLIFRLETFFHHSEYSGIVEGDDFIVEILYSHLYNSDDKLERSLRNKLMEAGLINEEYFHKLNTLWQNKLKRDKQIKYEEERRNAQKEKDKENFRRKNPYIPSEPIIKDHIFK